MTYDETDEALIELIVILDRLRANTEGETFDRLWEKHVLRDEEDEEDDSVQQQSSVQASANDGKLSTTPDTRGKGKGKASSNQKTPDETEEAKTEEEIKDLVVRLNRVRSKSKPAFFDRLWETHMARLDEVEEWRRDSPTYNYELNLANEPWASNGTPIPPSWPLPFPARLPGVMSVFISTAPVADPMHTRKAYHWIDAPVRVQDQQAFFSGLDTRANFASSYVNGYAITYSCDEVTRWIDNNHTGRKYGWSVLQRELLAYAKMGVGIWRLKVLVVGGDHAKPNQGKPK